MEPVRSGGHHSKDKEGAVIRHPEKITRTYGSTFYQVRVPHPRGTGMMYRRLPTPKAAQAFAASAETARQGGGSVALNIRFSDAAQEFRREHYIGLRPSAVAGYDAGLAGLE